MKLKSAAVAYIYSLTLAIYAADYTGLEHFAIIIDHY